MSKRYNHPIEVEVKQTPPGEPAAFRWRGRRYAVDRLLNRHLEVTKGWDRQNMKDLEYFCVEAEGGTFELARERLPQEKSKWKLFRVWD
ncbi:MAG: DUF6504 family protein [Actinomycetota bacterium]